MLEIGKVAEITGLSPHTLRAWEKRYSIKPAQRTQSGRRLYDNDTVEHLKLLKHCTDLGYSIGNTAHLPEPELRRLIDEARESIKHIPSEHKLPVSLVIVMISLGIGREPLLESLSPLYKTIDILHLDDFDELEAKLAKPKPDTDYLVSAYCENLNEASFSICSKLSAQGIPTLLCYNFGRKSIRESYERLGIYLQKAPLMGEWIRPIAIELQQRRLQDQQNAIRADKLPPANHVVPRVFSSRALEWINQNQASLKCECPNHISELIIKLNAFETYSQTCLVESPQDFDLHQHIYITTAQVRQTLENLLGKVLENEGIDPKTFKA